ncbi:MAG: phytanoyl-CoA dioxygenase family protein [Abditibacteriaceae bacterium]
MMNLTEQDVWNYDRDGYILMEDVFTQQEVAAMINEVEQGERVAQTRRGTADSSGKKAGIAIWHELGDDIWAAASTHPEIVNKVRILLHEEIAFFHGKVMLKEAGSGGAWEWHQDYGYWYEQGYIFPRMLSAFVALDEATVENGCLQVLRGSHKLGRLEHGKVGTQTGANMDRITQVEPFFERIHCTMKPGSVLFFNCNLLHTSAPNNSDHPRRSFIVCYNALANPQLGTRTSEDRPCPVADENVIKKYF